MMMGFGMLPSSPLDSSHRGESALGDDACAV